MNLAAAICHRFEAALIPPERGLSLSQRVQVIALKILTAIVLFFPACVGSFFPAAEPAPQTPVWEEGEPRVPTDIGVATAEFQDMGPSGLPHSNWAHWFAQKGIDTSEVHLPDIWTNPQLIVDQLREMGIRDYTAIS